MPLLTNTVVVWPCAQNFDPAAEAFKVLDPAGTGFADLDTMRAILSQMPGIGDVTDDDMKVVLELADSGTAFSMPW